MEFENSYSFSVDKSYYRPGNIFPNGSHPSGDYSILPFFGYYEYYKHDSITTTWERNTYDIKKTGTDSYQISKTPDSHSTHNYYYRCYKRVESNPFKGSKQLEDKFLSLLSSKNMELEKTPHICYNLDEYHQKSGGYCLVYLLKIIFVIAGIFCFIRWGKFILDTDPNYFLGLGGVVGIPLVVFLINRILNKINSKRTDKPLFAMGEDYINKLKDSYYKSMKSAYGEEMGEILKEYSIKRAQSQGTIY